MLNKIYFGTQILPTELPQTRRRPATPQHPCIIGACNQENIWGGRFIHAAFTVSHNPGQAEPFSLQVVIYTQQLRKAQQSNAGSCKKAPLKQAQIINNNILQIHPGHVI